MGFDNVVISGIHGRVRCEPGWRLDRAWANRLWDYDLWLVWSGQGRLRLRDRTVPLHPGTCLWMRPGGRYEATQDPQHRLGVSFVHFRLPSQPRFQPPFEVTEVRSLEFASAMLSEVMRWQADDATLAGRLMGDLLRVLARDHGEMRRAEPRRGAGSAARRLRKQRIEELANRINEEPGKKWRVADMAREVGFAPDHFSRVFQEVCGERPQAHVVRQRMVRAQQLLRETPLQVGEVAQVLGFRDAFHFSRQFRARHGVSPSAFRRGRGTAVVGQGESSA